MRAFVELVERLAEGTGWEDATNEFLFALGAIGIQKWQGRQLLSEATSASKQVEVLADKPMTEIHLPNHIIYRLIFHDEEATKFASNDVARLLRGLYALSQDLERLKTDAIHDPLTGVLNRRGLEEWFENRIRCHDRGQGFVLVYMDLDNFKAINDSMGHAKGDEALVHVTNALLQTLRSTDIVARVGGDEFVFIIDHMVCHPDYKQRLHDIVSSLSLTTYAMTATFGAVCYPVHGIHLVDLLNKADQSLYEGKTAGRNCIRFWEDCQ